MRYESSGESSVNGGGATKKAAWCRRQEHAKEEGTHGCGGGANKREYFSITRTKRKGYCVSLLPNKVVHANGGSGSGEVDRELAVK